MIPYTLSNQQKNKACRPGIEIPGLHAKNVKSDEYRCEAYAILYSFHQSDNPIEAFAQGYEAGAKSREQVSEQQIETVSRILYKCSFGFPFDEDSIDGMFDHAVQSGHMPCRRKAEQLIEALARARKEPAC